MKPLRINLVAAVLLGLTLACGSVFAQEEPVAAPAAPTVSVLPSPGDVLDLIDKAAIAPPDSEKGDWSASIKLAVVFAFLAVLPSLLVMTTSFTRIIIVLSFLRRALTTQNIPPTVAIIGLAMCLTRYAMAQTGEKMSERAIGP